MITLTRLDGREVVVNCDHILTVEPTPDTVLSLTTGDRLLVKEPVSAVVDRVVAFRRRLGNGPHVLRRVELPADHESHDRRG